MTAYAAELPCLSSNARTAVSSSISMAANISMASQRRCGAMCTAIASPKSTPPSATSSTPSPIRRLLGLLQRARHRLARRTSSNCAAGIGRIVFYTNDDGDTAVEVALKMAFSNALGAGVRTPALGRRGSTLSLQPRLSRRHARRRERRRPRPFPSSLFAPLLFPYTVGCKSALLSLSARSGARDVPNGMRRGAGRTGAKTRRRASPPVVLEPLVQAAAGMDCRAPGRIPAPGAREVTREHNRSLLIADEVAVGFGLTARGRCSPVESGRVHARLFLYLAKGLDRPVICRWPRR